MAKKHRAGFEWGCMLTVVLYFFLIAVVYYSMGKQLYERASNGQLTSLKADYTTGEFAGDYVVRQIFTCQMDTLEGFCVFAASLQRENRGTIKVSLRDDTAGTVLYSDDTKMSEFTEGAKIRFDVPRRIEGIRGHVLALELSAADGKPGTAGAVWYCSTGQPQGQQLFINDEPVQGTLCFETYGTDFVWTGPRYWKILLPLGGVVTLYCMYLIALYRRGKRHIFITMAEMFEKYRFLMRQLVSRDFKIKYKRSVLGVLWSFVNPLFMMLVQYVVFSTIFQTDIPNYPVYLLTGIVLFNFFNESTNISLYAITGNAGLITKVYVPKYIYPMSKVFSGGINLLISLIPMLILAFATGIRFKKAWLLLPYVLCCLFVFCMGMAFLLSAVMVFFRDMQFIWSVFCMVFTYATPIFYPESILPETMKGILAVNPMYHYICFFRTIILYGISPQPRQFFICALFSAIFLGAGIGVFRKLQDRFIFYI